MSKYYYYGAFPAFLHNYFLVFVSEVLESHVMVQHTNKNQPVESQQTLVPSNTGPDEMSTQKECVSSSCQGTDLCNKGQTYVTSELSAKEENTHSCSLQNILNKNESLRQTIQELIQDFQSGKLSQQLNGEVRRSEEALSPCNGDMAKNEPTDLLKDHEDGKSWQHLCTDKLQHINVLKEDKNKQQAQIINVNKEIQMRNIFKGRYKQLEVEEQVLRARCEVLSAAHAEISQQLHNEEDWRSKYYTLRDQTNSLRDVHDAVTQKIWALSREMKSRRAIKAVYKTQKAQNTFLIEQNMTLQTEMEHLCNKILRQRAVEEENHAMKAVNKALSKENVDLKRRVYKFHSSVKDKKFLAIMSESLAREKEAMIWENAILHKKLLKLENKMDKTKALERMEIGKTFLGDSVDVQGKDCGAETTWDDLSRDTLDHINALRRVNVHLQKHIHIVKRRLQNRAISKCEYKQLESQRKVLQMQCVVLNRTRSNMYETLRNTEDWRSKCTELKREMEALQESNHKLFQEIQTVNEDLWNLSVLKAEHNAVLAENTVRNSKNSSQQTELDELRTRLLEEEKQEENNDLPLVEEGVLGGEASDVKRQLKELEQRGEQALAFINASVRLERDILSRQNEALHGQVHKLTKILEGANTSESQ